MNSLAPGPIPAAHQRPRQVAVSNHQSKCSRSLFACMGNEWLRNEVHFHRGRCFKFDKGPSFFCADPWLYQNRIQVKSIPRVRKWSMTPAIDVNVLKYARSWRVKCDSSM